MQEQSYTSPWKKLSVKKVYETPWIRVEENDVIRPNGSQGMYGWIHFKNKAIGIIPVDDAMNTWLVGQHRFTLNEYSWEIPTGGVPMNEDSLTGAKRELKEETGLVAEEWKELLKIHTSNSVTDEFGYIYLATKLTQLATAWDETEVLQIIKLPLCEAVSMVMDGEITDSLSIAGLLKAGKILRI
jgi:8-oxo-dGTP pyrophosphatase MutT (NUDIX family)